MLTSQERRLARQVLAGRSLSEIAAREGLSPERAQQEIERSLAKIARCGPPETAFDDAGE